MNTKYQMLLLFISVCMISNDCFSINQPEKSTSQGQIIAKCDFEGPYVKRSKNDRLQEGCVNNYSWGKKIIHIFPDTGGVDGGKCQCIHVKGITSGQLQFWYTKMALWRGFYYKFTFWAKGVGFQGADIAATVRKISGPWTTYLSGMSFKPTKEWKKYTFVGKAPTDVDNDFGLMFATGGMGKLWIDNIRVEKFDENPLKELKKEYPIVKGNLFPRSSFEGWIDNYWTSGVYGGPDAEWEDPQSYRSEGGLFGKYCMAIPVSLKKGSAFCRSFWLNVVPGKEYQFSISLKAEKSGSSFSVSALRQKGKPQGVFYKRLKLTDQWQRFSVKCKIPAGVDKIFISLGGGNCMVYADGVELKLCDKNESGDNYQPRFPLELYADIGQKGGNIIKWGETIPLKLYAASALQDEERKSLKVSLKVTAFPDLIVMEKKIKLPVNIPLEMPLDLKRNGLFRISLTPEDKTLAAAQEILVAKLPEPRNVGKESSFGTHITVRPFFIDFAKKIGMKWVRFHDGTRITKWFWVEAKQGKYRWYDKQVNAVIDAGLHILGLPDFPPKWARIKPGKGENVIKLDAYRKFIRKIAQHYKGRIDYWEIWNEPYMKYFFRGTPKQYAQILNIGSKIIKEVNPQAKILGFCTEINGIPWARKVPEQDRKLIDILSFHCYIYNLAGGGASELKEEVQAYKNFLGKDASFECWNSEGNNDSLGRNSFYSFLQTKQSLNKRAAAFGARVWMEQAKAGIDKFFLYTTHQSDSIMYYGGYKLLIGYDRSITPAAVTTAVTAWCIDGLKCVECPQEKAFVQALFQGKKRSTWSVYSDPASEETKHLDLTKLPENCQVLDTMGNDPRQSAKTLIPIGIAPIFVLSNTLSASQLQAICNDAIN